MDASRPSPTGKRTQLILDDQQLQALTALTRHPQRQVADRARVVLALARGDNSPSVARQHALHPVAVRRIKQRFLARGVEGVPAGKHSGRPPHKRTLVQQTLAQLQVRQRIEDSRRGVLSAADIAQEVLRRHGVRVSVATVRAALKRGDGATEERDTP